ncbi:MAG: NADH-quinone oxidoreductase subunit NuoE [Chloroflexi bacterium]|nr:NADH-quinone oxidoreductase subunit NuoE [Chloroflexota bacterium]
MLSERAHAEIQTAIAKYPDKRSALMPALYIAQREYGWLPGEAIKELAEIFCLSETQVGSVASFYTMYDLQSVGKHVVLFCTDLPCALRGAEEMLEQIEHKLGCKAGATTTDGKITLREAPCLGGCDHAPVMLIDNEEHAQDLTPEKIDELIERLRRA